MKIEVYDPAMCCSSGVCGPSVDAALVRFAADLNWLREQGQAVERYNLSQQPAAFMANAAVRRTLQTEGVSCLPLILLDGEIAYRGRYPTRRELAAVAGLEAHARRP